jgi:hypothetical protein
LRNVVKELRNIKASINLGVTSEDARKGGSRITGVERESF